MQSEFPPLRTKQDEPIDLGESIEQRVEQYVRQSIEEAFAGAGPHEGPLAPPPKVPKTTRLAAWGALNLVLLGLAVVVVILLVRAAVLGRNGAAPPDPAKGQREHALHAL